MRHHRSTTLAAIVGLGVACGGVAPPDVEIRFQSHALLEQADRIATWFYADFASCNEVRSMLPRPAPSHGPFVARLDAASQERGLSFVREDIPIGRYVVLVDAHDGNGTIVGTGCAEAQNVVNREVSKIRITIEAPPDPQ